MTLPFSRLRTPRAAALAAAALVALAGVVLVLLGVAKATVWAPDAVTVAKVAGQAGAPVVVTNDAATALDGPSVRVDVRGPGDRQVFVGVGRADDVAAYLGDAARTEVTGVRDGQGVVTRQGSEASLPEPAGVDVWALSATGRGTATLTWPQAPGRWRVVAAVDGATPPTEVVLTWQRARTSSAAPALFAVGGLLLALGLVGGWAARRSLRAAPANVPVPGPERVAAPVPVADRLGRERPAPAGSRRAARLGATGDLPAVPRGGRVPDDVDDEPEDEVAPAPFRQPPGGIS